MNVEDIKIFGNHDENTLAQMRTVAEHEACVGAVLCGDGHLGYAVPIGGVVAYDDHISPSGVGYDISCGVRASRLDIPAKDVRARIKPIMDDIWNTVSFGMGRRNKVEVEHLLFDSETWHLPAVAPLKESARRQLGTVGGGNHFVDLMADENGHTWAVTHFGSRGLGHKTATYFLNAGGAKDGMMVAPLVIGASTALGHDYIQCMELAGQYAYAGRDWVIETVAGLLGAHVVETVHSHHNYCIAGDQKIQTPSGPKRMRDITAGDTVYAFDEAAGLVETRVSDQWCSGQKKTYTLRTRSRELRVSGSHPVMIVRVESRPHPERPWFPKRQGCLTWVQASEVKPGDALVCAAEYYRDDLPIGEELARFVGAYLGDGWRRHSNPGVSGYSIGLAIGSAGDSHTQRYAELCRALYPRATWRCNQPGAFGITCSSKEVHQALAGLDIGNKAQTKHIPAFAYTLPTNEKLALLAGYFDADGSVASGGTSNHGRGAICGVSLELVEGLRELAISCGMQVTPVNRETRVTNFGPCTVFRCTLGTDSMERLELWHEGKSSNQRITQHKKAQGLQASKLGYVTLPPGVFAQSVTEITVSELPEAVYDLTVEHESHSFVCEGVVVHNCWLENHGGRDLWVVRKGATPAFPGQRGFVGGSMGDDGYILEGVETPESASALYSTVHGAGRAMSRTQAAGKRDFRTGAKKSEGAITKHMMLDWLKAKGVELRGADTDEAPQAYKRLSEVVKTHGNTVRIVHTLSPMGVAMAGPEIRDPYKD